MMNANIEHYTFLERENFKCFEEVIEKYFANLPWSADDCVADAGCGPGTMTKEILHHLCPVGMKQKIWAFDINRRMIEKARVLNPDPRIEYIVADIEDRNTFPKEWTKKFTKVFANFSLHWMQDLKVALKNIHDILSSNGHLLAIISANSNIWTMADKLQARPRWANYLKDVMNVVLMNRSNFSKDAIVTKIFSDAGFSIAAFERKTVCYAFQTVDELKDTIRCIGPFFLDLPPTLREEYIEEYATGMLEISGGKPEMSVEIIVITAQKMENVN